MVVVALVVSLILFAFKGRTIRKVMGGGEPKKNSCKGKCPKKIHARENVRKKIHAQDGPHFDMKP